MNSVVLTIYSCEPHISQILTGFQLISKHNKMFSIEVVSANNTSVRGAYVEAIYNGKHLVYDVMDGYQDLSGMGVLLENCDLYFKRSFSAELNQQYFPQQAKRIIPLGFNYHVSCRHHPIDSIYWKEQCKRIFRIENDSYRNTRFKSKVFEERPRFKNQGFRVLFSTRLWAYDPCLPEHLIEERHAINETRIQIIKSLRELEGIQFLGGLTDTALSRAEAPSLILPAKLTDRSRYLRILHSSDICIGTTSLHNSIGWKTGEYVAAAKAIVSEPFHYEVPGDFREGINYLTFSSASECVERVRQLASDPETVYKMRCANHAYYCRYLRPEKLILRTLQIADGVIETNSGSRRD